MLHYHHPPHPPPRPPRPHPPLPHFPPSHLPSPPSPPALLPSTLPLEHPDAAPTERSIQGWQIAAPSFPPFLHLSLRAFRPRPPPAPHRHHHMPLNACILVVLAVGPSVSCV
jgi:hypothetical protein